MAQYAGSIEPDFTPDYTTPGRWREQEEGWLARLKAQFQKTSKGDIVGETLQFPRADGYAVYVITKQRPFTVAHLALGDAWHADRATIRGLTLKDAKARVENNRALRKMMDDRTAAHKAFYEEQEVGTLLHMHDHQGRFKRYKVVRATEDCGHRMSPIKKGEKAVVLVALVGNWKSVTYDGYEAKKIREGELQKPGATNFYEHPDFNRRWVDGHGDPALMEPCVIAPSKPKPPSGGEIIVGIAKMRGIDLGTPEGEEWLKETINKKGTPAFRELYDEYTKNA